MPTHATPRDAAIDPDPREETTVLAVGGDELFLELVTRGVRIVDFTRDGERAVKLSRRLQPSVVVLDADECKGDAPRLATRIRRAAPAACVMIVAASATPREVEHAVEAGVSGYVGKNGPMYTLLGALLEGARYRRLRSA